MSVKNHNKEPYFLPYQIAWLNDESTIKIWEKSRRIGATYVQSYEDVRDCLRKKVPAVWFSSADESAAREYIYYCAKWAKAFNMAARQFDSEILEDERKIKTFTIEFADGRRINALSSNPKSFRSKGGKVVLDEFAWHDRPDEMWAAARPVITWGYPLRILSTHNGKSGRYYRFVEDVKKGVLNWSLHTTTIWDAVNDGLVDKIMGRPTSRAERERWVDDLHKSCGDENTWLQEYMCVPVDEASAFLTYDLITLCESDDVLLPQNAWPFIDLIKGDLYLGMDIARKKHLSVIYLLEKLGRQKYTRAIKLLRKTKFKVQRQVLFSVLKHPKLRRACIDATGLGMQLAEEAQDAFGKYRVEAVNFSGSVKEELAYTVLRNFEDRQVEIPPDPELREDLHSVRKIVTVAGNIRFDVSRSDTDGHADRFWALGLALHAAENKNNAPLQPVSRKKRLSYQMLKGY